MRDATSRPSSPLLADCLIPNQNPLRPKRRTPGPGGNASTKTRGWMSCHVPIAEDDSSEHDGLILYFPASPPREPILSIHHENRHFIADFGTNSDFPPLPAFVRPQYPFFAIRIAKHAFSIISSVFERRRRPFTSESF